MAKLPGYTQRQVIAQEATPGAAPVDRSMAQATKSLGAGLMNLAQAQNQMMQREARDYTLQSQNEMTVGLEAERVRLTKESKNGSEYVTGLENYIEQAKQKALDSAPNQAASDLTSEYFDSLLASEKARAIPVAAEMNAQNTVAVTQEALQLGFNETQRDPDSFDQNVQKGALIISTSDIPESEKEGAVRAYRNELAWYRFTGMVSENPARAKKELESGAWDHILDADKQRKLLTAASQQINSLNASSQQKLTGEINDYIAYKSAGGEDTRSYSENMLKAVYGADKGAEVYAQIKDVESFSDNLQKVKLADAEDIEGLLSAELVSGPEDFKTQSAQQKSMIAAINQRNKQLSSDPAQYALQSDNVKNAYENYTQTGDGASFAATTIAEQKRLGVPGDFASVLSKPQADQLVSQYQQGNESAAEFIQNLRNQFGDYFPVVMRDLTGAGLSPNAATVSVLPQGSRGATYLAQADKEGYKTIKANLDPDDYKDITTSVFDAVGDFDSTSYSEGTRAQVKQSVELLAMKYLSAGIYDSPKKAVEAAADDVVNSRYEYQDTYRVPIERDAYMIERGVDRLIPSILEMDLLPPRSATLPPDLAQESYKSSLKPKAVTLNDDSGVVIYDNQNEPVLDSEGNLIIYTWDELEKLANDDKYLPLRRGR